MTTAHNKPDLSTPPRLLTVYEVADLLGKSREWVYRQADVGNLPVIRVGRSIRFDPTEIAAWLDERREGPRSEPTSRPG